MNRIFNALLLVASLAIGSADAGAETAREFNDRFYEEVFAKKYPEALATLAQWETSYPDDGELWPARFNYHINKSRQSVLNLSADTIVHSEEALMLTNEDGTLAGSIQPLVMWDDDEFNLAIEAIESGIKARPERLDYRLGEVTAFRYRDMNAKAVDLLIDIARTDVAPDTRWLWTDDEEIPGNVVDAISDVAAELFYSEEDDDDEAFRRLIAASLQLYPDNFMILNYAGTERLISHDYDQALVYFDRALSLNPGDDIIESNIAYSYLLKGDQQKALELYTLLRDDPETDPDIRAEAADFITRIQSSADQQPALTP